MAHVQTLTGRSELDWQGVFWSGLIAGIVFMMLEMLMVWLFMGQSPWGPPRMIAAMALGRGVLPPPASFDFSILMAAMIIHFMLAWVHAALFAWVFGGLGMGAIVAVGALAGFAIYLIDFYIFTGIWPWFAEARNWITIVSHIVYGAVLGWSYRATAHRMRLDGRAL